MKLPAQIQRILLYTSLAFALFSLPAGVLSQVKEPVVDDIPDVTLDMTESIERYRVRLTLYGKEPVTGEIILRGGSSINPSGDPQRIYRFTDISRITINSWSKNRKGDGWVFYPAGYEIILKDQTRVSHAGNIGFLNRISFASGQKKTVYVYTYFYDYFKKGKWINSGSSDFEGQISVPAPRTLYIIELK